MSSGGLHSGGNQGKSTDPQEVSEITYYVVPADYRRWSVSRSVQCRDQFGAMSPIDQAAVRKYRADLDRVAARQQKNDSQPRQQPDLSPRADMWLFSPGPPAERIAPDGRFGGN